MEGYDVVVVGGGSAGCVLAARLSEDLDRSVCLIEAGPDYGPYAEGRWPSDLLNAHQLAAVSHDWGIEGGWPSWRARVLGGCSAHNGCFVVWGPPVDYDEWAQAGNPGWSHHREERRLLLPPAGDGDPDHGPGDAAFGVTKSARLIKLPSGFGSGAGWVGGVLAAGGWACQHRPARSLHPGRGGRSRPGHEGRWSARSRPLAVSLARLSRTSQTLRWRSLPDAWPVVAGSGVIERTTK